MENQQACVWATSKELWDSFLNDPELARALDSAQLSNADHNSESEAASTSGGPDESARDGDSAEQHIGARLKAYETPITDEILRQSIR